jgi:hypothetical protein
MIRSLIALMIAAASLTGCAVQSQGGDDEGAVDESEDALAAAKLYGTWDGEGGPFYSITFTKDYAETLGGGLKGKRFDASIDTGVRCITYPCDAAQLDVSGVYKLSKGYRLTLASYDRPSLEFSKILGEYNVYLGKDGKLTLIHRETGNKEVFHKAAAPAPEKCGTTTCAAGTYCCNPLTNTCVKPGMMCAF